MARNFTASALRLKRRQYSIYFGKCAIRSLQPSRRRHWHRRGSRSVKGKTKRSSTLKPGLIELQRNGLFIATNERKVKKYEFDQPPNTIDPITAVYLARSQDFKVGDHLYFNIFGGKYRYLLDLEVERREKIQIASGSVDAFKIVPRIKNVMKQGYAERMNEAAVWISADERRIPVMLSSRIFVGSIYIERIEDRVGPQTAGARHPDHPS